MARSPKPVLAPHSIVSWWASIRHTTSSQEVVRSFLLLYGHIASRVFFQFRSTSSLRVEVPIPSSAAPSGSSTATARSSDAPVSWSWLYGLWQSGRLTRLALADVADSAQVHQYFSIAPSASLVSPRSRLAEFLSVVSVGLAPRVPASGPLACVPPVPGLLSVPTRAHFLKSEAPRQEGFDERSARIDTGAHSLNSVLPASTDANDHDAAPRKVQRTGSANWATGSGELSTDGIFDSGPPASSPPGFLASGSAVFGVGTGSSSTWPQSPESTKSPLGPSDQRGHGGDGISSLLLQTAAVSQGLRFKCFALKV